MPATATRWRYDSDESLLPINQDFRGTTLMLLFLISSKQTYRCADPKGVDEQPGGRGEWDVALNWEEPAKPNIDAQN